MADRRMFAKTIIDSDAFLDMPQSTQLLYFHLAMRADDDGFINNPKSIARNVKCNEDDLKILAMKKFIIPFESGIVVIKHWKIHNYIRTDRYKETKYKEEKSRLMLDENKAYSVGIPSDNQVTTNGIPSDNQMDTQVRLGKDSIGKYSINIKESNTNVLPKKKTNYQEIIDKYNSICKSLPKVMKLSDSRRKAINARLDKFSLEEIISVFEKAEQSNFLKGANNRNWKADFDWIMSDRNMAKILEGKYDNCNALKDNSATVTSSNTNTDRNTYTSKTTNRFNNFTQRQYSDEYLNDLEMRLLKR